MGAEMLGVSLRQHFLSLDFHGSRVSPRCMGHPGTILPSWVLLHREETTLLDLENWRCRVFPRRQGSPSVELSINSAVSLLFNLEAAQQGRRVLFLDEQKLLLKGWKKGFVKNTKLDFMRR
jgi:hypothetical protein